MLDSLIASYGIGNNNKVVNLSFHIFIIGRNHKKIFFTEDGEWTEDVNLRAESTDFIFVYETLSSLLNEEDMRIKIEACLLF